MFPRPYWSFKAILVKVLIKIQVKLLVKCTSVSNPCPGWSECAQWGLVFGVWSLRFGVWGLRFGVESLEVGVWGLVWRV